MSLTVGLLVAGLGAGRSSAKDVCVEQLGGPTHHGCGLCDLPYPLIGTGWSSGGLPCVSGPGYGAHLSLSASDTDHSVNVGQLSTVGPLHLWLVNSGCTYGFGFAQVRVQGDLLLNSYEPVATGSHTWQPSPDLHGGTLTLGLFCVSSPTIIGTFRASHYRMRSIAPEINGPLSTNATTWGRIKSLYGDPARVAGR